MHYIYSYAGTVKSTYWVAHIDTRPCNIFFVTRKPLYEERQNSFPSMASFTDIFFFDDFSVLFFVVYYILRFSNRGCVKYKYCVDSRIS